MRVDHSQAPGAFAHDIDTFLAFIGLERGLSQNTIAAYRRDLDQAATFLAQSKVTDWRGVTRAEVGAWIHSLDSKRYKTASLARKLTAVRMLARFLVREKSATMILRRCCLDRSSSGKFPARSPPTTWRGYWWRRVVALRERSATGRCWNFFIRAVCAFPNSPR